MSLPAGHGPPKQAIPERTILDECYAFVSSHVAASEPQKVAMVAYAAATHAMRVHVTMGRMLFTSQEEESGKTVAMMVTASLSSAPLDASGTSFALASALAAASNEPEKPPVTPYQDEISDVFNRSGLGGANNPVGSLLRRGYKRGATDSRSVNRVPEYYSIFTPFLMTGLRTAVPRDIRSRCIVIDMKRGKPARFFDAREAEPYAAELAKSLGGEVKRRSGEIEAFRALGLHVKMAGRKMEVWEPLCAAVYALGGPRWLSKVVSAFTELALDASDVRALTPSETVVRDVAGIAEAYRGATGLQFVDGLVLADELRHIGGPLYDGRSDVSLAKLASESLPFNSEQRTVNGRKVRGYPVSALAAAWEAARPVPAADLEPAEEVNPFACDDEEEGGETEEEADDSVPFDGPYVKAPVLPVLPVLPVPARPRASRGRQPRDYRRASRRVMAGRRVP
jgi:hypothetical protein